jgi:EAL domain-containing protein (putative c-di-GMP-specific phosphodiesterase class I)
MFVRDCTADHRAAGIIELDVSMGEKFGMSIVAEGIETIDQWRRVKELGVGYGQGFLIGKPISAADTSRWLNMEEPTLHSFLQLAEQVSSSRD